MSHVQTGIRISRKTMALLYRGKEIFKPLNTGRIDDHVSCVREFIANIFFYTKGDATLMIDAGYNYPRLKEKMGWLDIDPVKIKHILITHQDTDHVGAVETDSDGLFRTAKLYIGAVENRYLTGEVRRKVIFGLYKLPMESWSPGIVKVTEKDYADGYLKGGYRKTPITRLFNWIMRTFHMSFMLHVEFNGSNANYGQSKEGG